MSTYPTIFGRSCRRPRDHAAGRTDRDLGRGQSTKNYGSNCTSCSSACPHPGVEDHTTGRLQWQFDDRYTSHHRQCDPASVTVPVMHHASSESCPVEATVKVSCVFTIVIVLSSRPGLPARPESP